VPLRSSSGSAPQPPIATGAEQGNQLAPPAEDHSLYLVLPCNRVGPKPSFPPCRFPYSPGAQRTSPMAVPTHSRPDRRGGWKSGNCDRCRSRLTQPLIHAGGSLAGNESLDARSTTSRGWEIGDPAVSAGSSSIPSARRTTSATRPVC
jgi:hypothetical protein